MISYFYIFSIVLVTTTALNESNNSTERQKRVLGVFTVVKFPNTACVAESTSRNGTCFTASECISKGGYSSGDCASGFGVCCIIEKTCGGSSSENCTYFTSSAATKGQNCALQVCKCSSDVCQLRLDFDSFIINDPITATVTTAIVVNKVVIVKSVATAQAVNERGKCAIDTFQAFGDINQSVNPPTICGINTGQHMYLDASDQCNILQLGFGTGSSATLASAVSIKVTQVKCSSKQEAPDGCLQYFTEDSGTIKTYNNGGTGIHLASQDYRICVRPARGMCSICYSALNTAFGFGSLSETGATAILGTADSYCGTLNDEGNTDYITIPGASCPSAIAAQGYNDRYCGTELVCVKADMTAQDVVADNVAANTVCTSIKPFRIDVFTDVYESALAAISEGGGTAGPGQVGFEMAYWQSTSCHRPV